MHGIAWLHLPNSFILYSVLSQFPGVPIFFFISGFLITSSVQSIRSRGSFKYVMNRVFRIYPGLAINILLLELFMLIGGDLSFSHISLSEYTNYLLLYITTASKYISSMLLGIKEPYYYHAFFSNYPSGVLWTLTVELTFYFLLPLIILPFKNRKVLTFIIAIIIGCSFYYSSVYMIHSEVITKRPYYLVSITAFPYLWIFLAGSLFKLYWKEIKVLFEKKFIYWVIVYSFVVWLLHTFFHIGIWLPYKYQPNWITLFRILLMITVVISFSYSFTNLSKYIRDFDASYGVYLYHMLIVGILISMHAKPSLTTWFVLISMSLLAAVLSYYIVEKKGMQLKTWIMEKLSANNLNARKAANAV